MSRDTFEVYYNQNGRWQLHASFEAGQRDLAIEEAKTVETKEGYATRVVRETYLADSNTTESAITWQSQKAKAINDSDNMFGTAPPPPAKGAQKPGQKRQPPPRQAQPRQAPPPPEPKQKAAQQKSAAFQPAPVRPPGKKRKKKKKERGVITRLLIVIASSAAIAVGSAAGVVGVLYVLIRFGLLAQGDYVAIVAGTLVLAFFLSVFVNLQKHFGFLSLLKSQPSAPKRAGPEAMMAATAKKKKAAAQDIEFDQVSIEDLREKVMQEDALAEGSASEDAALDEEDAPPSLDADMGTEVSPRVHQAQAPEPAAPPPQVQVPAAPPPEVKREAQAAPPPPQPKPAAPPPPSGEAEARATFTRFVGDTMRNTPSDINAFTRFGLNLYVAGAGSVIGQTKRLPRDAQLGVVKQGLQASGMPGDRAESFCVELPSHGKNPKYAGMIQAGVKAMQAYLGGNGGVTGQISNLLQEWNLPEKRAAIPSIITFVFTDIVGSTAMTQRLGNAGAQKAVRAHNTAVRGAIQAYKGREVKHTGDGIMATFPDSPSAVAACIKIQREIAAHNGANPNIDVHLRIGINAGEAVEEENDFFGAAVQMTARICDKAAKDNIWVSQAVVDGCKGQRFGFIPRGAFEMKGIQGPKRLFEVGWSDVHKNELADL